jgi:hypothetical protein
VAGGEELRDEPDQRTAERHGAQQDDADRGVADQPRYEEVAGLARGGGQRHRDAHREEPAHRLLHALPAHEPQEEDEQRGRHRRPDARAQTGRGVADEEGQRRQGRVDHPAPAAERLDHQLAVEHRWVGVGAGSRWLRVGGVPSRPVHGQPAPSSYQGL